LEPYDVWLGDRQLVHIRRYIKSGHSTSVSDAIRQAVDKMLSETYASYVPEQPAKRGRKPGRSVKHA